MYILIKATTGIVDACNGRGLALGLVPDKKEAYKLASKDYGGKPYDYSEEDGAGFIIELYTHPTTRPPQLYVMLRVTTYEENKALCVEKKQPAGVCASCGLRPKCK